MKYATLCIAVARIAAASPASAQGAELDADLSGRLSAGIGFATGDALSLDPQLRYYVHDRITVGTRLRLANERTDAAEVDVGISLDVDTIKVIERLRTDAIALTGAGVAFDGTPLVFGGVALRVQPRTRWTFDSSLVFELGGRATWRNETPVAAELMVSALVLWPPIRRMRDCYRCGWH